jgi:ATP-dependent Lon protease
VRAAHHWGRRFPEQLGDDALEALSRASPRDMRRAILHAFGEARIDGRDVVRADDIRPERGARRRPIGF